jgi:hypothetical protein
MAQFAAKQVLNELNGAYFISVMTDTSNWTWSWSLFLLDIIILRNVLWWRLLGWWVWVEKLLLYSWRSLHFMTVW